MSYPWVRYQLIQWSLFSEYIMFQWFINLFKERKAEAPVGGSCDKQESTAKRAPSPTFAIKVDSIEYRFENYRWIPDRMIWKDMEVQLHTSCLYITPHRLYDIHEIDSMTAHVEYYWNPFMMEKESFEPTPLHLKAFAHILGFRNKGFRIRIVSGRIFVYVPQLNEIDWNEGLEKLFQIVSFWNKLSTAERYTQDASIVEGLSVCPHHELAMQDQPLSDIQEWLLSCFDGSSNDWCTAWWDKDGFHCTPTPYAESTYKPQKTAYYGALLWDWACEHKSES